MTLNKLSALYLDELGRISITKQKRAKGYLSHKRTLPQNIDTITSMDIQRWLAKLQKKFAPGTVKYIIQCWRKACEFGIEKGYILKNPFLKAKHPKISIPKIEPFTKDEVRVLLERSTGRLKFYLAFAFYTGARSCEILALKWNDIDTDSMTISISKSLANGTLKNRTKTGNDRIVPIFSGLLPYIKELEKQRNCEWVFSQNKRHLFGSTSLLGNGRWKALLADCGIAYRTARHTRHTFASYMVEFAIQNKKPIKWVAQILGHANIDMTLKVYTRFIQNEHLNLDRDIEIF